MKWISEVRRLKGPRYLAIADAVTRAIDGGELLNGTRLPTHRSLADQLELDVTTVTRAYSEIQRRGLAEARVGQGTFVLASLPDSPASSLAAANNAPFVDLSHNFPAGAPPLPNLRELANEVARDLDYGVLLGRQSDIGTVSHRAAGAAYLETLGVKAVGDDIVVCAGAQHGIAIAIAALTEPGESILMEATTFYGARTAARMLGRNVAPVAMDNDGLLPDALEEVLRSSHSRVLYCAPTLHNPTTTIMPPARRKAIARICERYKIAVIEDDVYGFLVSPRQEPLAARLSSQAIYITSFSKSCGPGFRLGYMRVPEQWRRAVGTALRATTLMAPPIEAEIAARLVRSRLIEQLEDAQRTRNAERQRIAEQAFRGLSYSSNANSFHVWLQMPADWQSEVFAVEAKLRGVGVSPAAFFNLDPKNAHDAVRVCLSAAESNDVLQRATKVLADLMASGNPWATTSAFA
ncbi:PLP-dependent aminotransferase family protein [Hyphomicrobium sp.]|uniref:aminotransferase-like domain-containing protein n=1 Tax=Hyphomicrobium sp. TaxID=82 RepID=UPI001D6D1211|nr:PLP-dependent aminotransferase family protein [Hyphomicrobium sp.]MBY0558747.1 PLP-dependent aminotransferase family protein [Hyphomicrobium sp.]